MQSHWEPSFFLTNKTGAPQGELLGQINPLSSNSCICIFNSANFEEAVLYRDCDIGMVQRNISIDTSTSLLCGNLGNLSGKTSRNSFTIGI